MSRTPRTPPAVPAPQEPAVAPDAVAPADAGVTETVEHAPAGVAVEAAEPTPPVEPHPALPPEVDVLPLRTDGPTLAEWVAAGYDAANYPPAGYEPVNENSVRRYRVKEYCRFVRDGVVSVIAKGTVIDSLNYDIAEVLKQGLPLEPATLDDIDRTPSVGHRVQ